MKKTIVLVVVLLLSTLAAVMLFKKTPKESGPASSNQEIQSIGHSEATIVWRSEKASAGKVSYRAVTEEKSQVVTETLGPSKNHEVVLKGLQPGTKYLYSIEDSGAEYAFQTMPLPTTPFSFLLTWGDLSDRILPLMMSEMPEFIVSLTPVDTSETDPYASIRKYMPLYDLAGVNSPYLKSRQDTLSTGTPKAGWNLDWGGLRLVFLGDLDVPAESLRAPSAHTLGLVLLPGLSYSQPWTAPDETTIRATSIHKAILEHNAQFPAQPASFVVIMGNSDRFLEIDDIRYLAIRVPPLKEVKSKELSGAVRIDVTSESSRGTFIADSREMLLRPPPLKEKRTCEECRRLADQGAYEESVKAYEEFIKNNAGHFQIDDAYFAIAEIQDEKLFKYSDALVWYRRLVEEYPDSALSPMARQRTEYLTKYSDNEYRPLARFERIRRIDYASAQNDREKINKCLSDIRAVLKDYPESLLAPVIQYWLAGQLRPIDPDQAVQTYRDLLKRPHEDISSEDISLAIGETYYTAARYKESIAAYREALAEFPSLADTINPQIMRCERNLRREVFFVVSWIVFAVIILLSVFHPPIGVSGRKFLRSSAAFVVLSGIILFAGFMIHEQFESRRQLLLLAFGFSICGSFGMPFSAGLVEKLCRSRMNSTSRMHAIFRSLLTVLLGLILLVVSAYLVIYYVYVHYLIVFKL